MKPVTMRRLLRALAIVLAVLVFLAIGGALSVRAGLRASLPALDGTLHIAGLSAPVRVTRDDLGIPTVEGATREDVARATGFLHAQDRFFQMDLARRRAAGELSALVGARALVPDREIRIHRFRAEAAQAVRRLPSRDRGILDAYTAGVNAGLATLGARPFEYLLLRQEPQPWRAEDSLLVVLSMFVTLQDSDGTYESTLGTLHDLVPEAMYEFLAPRGTEWDSPVIGAAFSTPPVPGPDVYNPRVSRRDKATILRRPRPRELASVNMGVGTWRPGLERWALSIEPWALGTDRPESDAIGSNNWAVAGRLTSNGGALVANDMHLGIRVPNTWYRAALQWPDQSSSGEPHRLIGVTLPGVPALVAGSNTYVAWGFTNTYADWSDIVLLDVDPGDADRYRTPDGWRAFEHFDETIAVAGAPDHHEAVTWTIWGPVLPPDYRGRPRAYRWVAHAVDRLAATVTPIEEARTIEQAFDLGNGLGTPGQNFVAADRSGRIGWSVYGAIPRRRGLDGQRPSSWADGTRGWDGWLRTMEYPRIIDPPGGRIWTANARVVDGEMLDRLGDGSYEIGSRAHIIRERLMARSRFTATDLLAIQLDTRAEFLERWRQLILQTLTPEAIAGNAPRTAFRDVVERTWSGEALPDSAAYRLTRTFRDLVSERVFAFVLADCDEADAAFDYTTVRRREGPLWTLVTGKPMHLLDPRYASWEQLLLETIDAVTAEAMQNRSGDLAARVWSEYNVTSYRHPLSAALPFIHRWLDMPARALPGDLYTPRVQWGAIGASERMVVSPGHEADGIMHMPTGQSGHPLSPFYGNSHEAWVEGRPTPFLPGPGVHRLTLEP